MGPCLAACGPSKAGVAYEGPCGPPSKNGGRASAAFSGAVDAHPIASLFDLRAPAAAAAEPVDVAEGEAAPAQPAPGFLVSDADVNRYAAEGFALVGVGRVKEYDVEEAGAALAASKKAGAGAGPDGKPLTGAAAEAAVLEPRVLAFAADTGLLYASTAPFVGSTKAGEAAVAAGERGPADAADAASDQDGEKGEKTTLAAPSPAGLSPDFQPDRWWEFVAPAPYPYRQHVWLDSGCSGTVIGPHVVGSAAHCVYSIASRAFYPLYTTRPAAFRTDFGRGPVQSPYGAYPSSRVLVLSGWTDNAANGNGQSVWFFDASVIVHAGEVSKDVGFAGFTYSPRGVAGIDLMTAGYPQTTQSRGRFVRYRTPCRVSDPDGDDSEIRVDVADCAVAEGGQSGSGIWDASNHVLHGVLSRGTDDYDVWYELTPLAFDFWTKHRDLTA
jgi:hypothetical protein